MTSKNILAVTGTRADYGLLSKTLKKINESNILSLSLCVTGTHLSKDFGMTKKFINEDGISIDHQINIINENLNENSVSRSVGLMIQNFSKYLEELRPDLILLLGDRYEIFAAATSALINRIPIAHIHGGELSEGAFDDALRHSITKMSHVHFTSCEAHRNRVLQLGEPSNNVFNVGAPGVELIKLTRSLSKEEIFKNVGIRLSEKNFIITYHPETLNTELSPSQQINNLLSVLEKYEDTNLIFTQANADPGGQEINDEILKFLRKNPNASLHASLGQENYLSILNYCEAMIGNSSSALIEAPSFKLPVLNIGNRQRARMRSNNVIDCENDAFSIKRALQEVTLMNRELITNPFDGGETSMKIVETLENIDLKDILKKKFNDLL